LLRRLLKGTAAFDFVEARIGVLYQRRRDADFAQHFALGFCAKFGRNRANFGHQILERLPVHVVSGRSRGALE
jgi:hypothetical protein